MCNGYSLHKYTAVRMPPQPCKGRQHVAHGVRRCEKSSAVILSEDAMILRLTTVHEKGLDSRFRGNDNNCVIPAKAGSTGAAGLGSEILHGDASPQFAVS